MLFPALNISKELGFSNLYKKKKKRKKEKSEACFLFLLIIIQEKLELQILKVGCLDGGCQKYIDTIAGL